MRRRQFRWLAICALLAANPAIALEEVSLQLKWTHAFQFAGYYAALEQGYYRDAGLDVKIVEASPASQPVDEVVQGRAQYGVGTSSLLIERAAGKPVVALAVVFQQSPYEIYASPRIHNLSDLIGKRLMVEPQSEELFAYLKKEGVPLDRIKLIPHSFDANGLMRGDADAISGYISDEPFYFSRAHFPYQTFSPRSVGIDFYGDNLFTSEKELHEHPARVKAFRAASLRGWKYAKEHPHEVIGLILAKYPTKHNRDYLDFESHQMVPLLQPNLIAIGYMNPERWRIIADTYADLGLLPHDYSLEEFLYDDAEPDMTWFYRGLALVVVLIGFVVTVTLYVLRINRKLRNSQSELSKSEKHYRLLVENMRDVVWILDPVSLRFRYVSPTVWGLRGYTAEEVMREPLDAALSPEYAAQLKIKMQHNVADFESGMDVDQIYVEEVRQPRKDGSWVWTEAIARFYRNEDTGQVEIHGVTRDISERKLAEEKIKSLAFFDSVTGLPNRMLLNDRLAQALVAAKRDGCRGALMFIDLDKFKQVNDTLGHDVGDELLLQVAVRMKECVRASDTVARIGGDEFIVLLRTMETTQDALNVAEKIRAVLRRPFDLIGQRLEISCSIGIALFPEHGDDAVELFKKADIAMYRAKDNGRDCVRLYENLAAPNV